MIPYISKNTLLQTIQIQSISQEVIKLHLNVNSTKWNGSVVTHKKLTILITKWSVLNVKKDSNFNLQPNLRTCQLA